MSGFWAVLSGFGDESNVKGKVFGKGLGFCMRKGNSVRFWYDDWVAVGPFCILFPRLFRVVSYKDASVKDCFVWNGNVFSWNISIRRALRQSELVAHQSLLSLLSNIFLCRKELTFAFGSPILQACFFTRRDPFTAVQSPCATVWTGLVPPRVEAFCWLAVAGKISTTDVLRRGLMSDIISDTFRLCWKEMESIDHLFIHCGVASSIWRYFLNECGVSWCFPGSLAMLS